MLTKFRRSDRGGVKKWTSPKLNQAILTLLWTPPNPVLSVLTSSLTLSGQTQPHPSVAPANIAILCEGALIIDNKMLREYSKH